MIHYLEMELIMEKVELIKKNMKEIQDAPLNGLLNGYLINLGYLDNQVIHSHL